MFLSVRCTKHQTSPLSVFPSTPDMRHSMGMNRRCSWHFSFHGDKHGKLKKKPPNPSPIIYPPAAPQSSSEQKPARYVGSKYAN